jgi:hypothetical protein
MFGRMIPLRIITVKTLQVFGLFPEIRASLGGTVVSKLFCVGFGMDGVSHAPSYERESARLAVRNVRCYNFLVLDWGA